MEKPLQIAIDGPVGAGKSEISARLARELGLTYLYTGAMYRAVALACIREKIGFKDEKNVLPLLRKYTIELVPATEKSKRPVKVLLSGEDVTEKLFHPDVDQGTSDVSTLPGVRAFLVKRQKELAKGKRVVMEGRDIGLRVLPEAQLKIYLTASPRERAKRRHAQWISKGIKHKTYEDALSETRERDDQDMHRQVDPLQKLADAWELDTTGMNPDQVVLAITKELKSRKLI